MQETLKSAGEYQLKCFRPDGSLRWETKSKNLVVNGGLQHMSQQFFKGAGYTATWYLGLYGSSLTNTVSSLDTMSGHAGWTEFDGYAQPTRPAAVFANATNASTSITTNAAAPAVLNINVVGPVVIGGAFLTNYNVKGSAAGLLYSAAPFLTPGDRTVYNGDELQLFYEHQLSAKS